MTHPTRAEAQPVLWLTCPAAAEAPGRDLDQLCTALESALQEALPGHDIRRSAAADKHPQIALKLDQVTPIGLGAHLDWQLPGQEAQSGASLRLTVSDAQRAAALYTPFARDLVRVSKEMLKTLNRP